MTREEAIEVYHGLINTKIKEAFEFFAPELAESEDERIRKGLIEALKTSKTVGELKFIIPEPTREECIAYLEKQKDSDKAIHAVDRIDKYIDENVANAHDMKDSDPDKKYYLGWDDALGKMAGILQDVYSGEKQKDQKPIKIEAYEVGKGTTVCGQDYKCKKDYKVGNCWYIKDAIYHCGRDGYLTDQNGVSWSCTPEWFNEYIQSNTEWAEEEKTRFVSGQFLQCKLSFDEFKEGEHYWLEYIGDDMYVGRSDNILNQKFHITPRQLFTLFSQELEEVQGPPQEEKQVSLNYEPSFNENPSDNEIIEALIHHLNEQDGFLTAINCVSTKAILSWLIKQKEQNPKEVDESTKRLNDNWMKQHFDDYEEQKPVEWSEEDDKAAYFINQFLEYHEASDQTAKSCKEWFNSRLKSLRPQINQGRQIKKGDKVRIHCRKDRKGGRITVYDGKVGEVIDIWDAKRNPWGHICVRIDNGCNDGFYEDELEIIDEPSWKPSKEQIYSLGTVVNGMGESDFGVSKNLRDLYEQLKKL